MKHLITLLLLVVWSEPVKVCVCNEIGVCVTYKADCVSEKNGKTYLKRNGQVVAIIPSSWSVSW